MNKPQYQQVIRPFLDLAILRQILLLFQVLLQLELKAIHLQIYFQHQDPLIESSQTL